MGKNDVSARIFQRIVRRLGALVYLVVLSAIASGSRRPILVVATPFGNLGNRLFLHANLIAFAIENHSMIVNPAFHPWRRVFTGTAQGPLACYPPSPLPSLASDIIETMALDLSSVAFAIASACSSFWKLGAIEVDGFDQINLDCPQFAQWAKSKRVILLRGYNFIANQSMASHVADIRPYFRQVISNDASAQSPVHRLRAHCDLVIGVVIRLGGFDKWLGGRYYFPVPTYLAWIRQASQLWPDKRVGIFVCCDRDLDLSQLTDLEIEFRPQHALENRAALLCCDFIMAPPSSFAGWAAFIAGIPLQLLHSSDQMIREDLFLPIHNHTDLIDSSYPAATDITQTLLQP